MKARPAAPGNKGDKREEGAPTVGDEIATDAAWRAVRLG